MLIFGYNIIHYLGVKVNLRITYPPLLVLQVLQHLLKLCHLQLQHLADSTFVATALNCNVWCKRSSNIATAAQRITHNAVCFCQQADITRIWRMRNSGLAAVLSKGCQERALAVDTSEALCATSLPLLP